MAIDTKELFEDCPRCNGTGDHPQFEGQIGGHCEQCNGRGELLTKEGKIFRDFIKQVKDGYWDHPE